MFLRERWRQVPSLPFIQASSFGRVRIPTPIEVLQPKGGGIRTYVIKPRFGAWNAKRKRFVFWAGQTRKQYYVARLVCEAFHGPPPPGKPYCIHKDDNTRNNKPDNLKWATQRENLNAAKFMAHVRSRPRRGGKFI